MSNAKTRPQRLRQIGNLFDMDHAAVSQTVKRFENKIKKDKIIYETNNKITKVLKKGRKC